MLGSRSNPYSADERRQRYYLAQIKKKSKQLKIEFNIDWYDIIIPDTCPVFGFKIVQNKGVAKGNSITIDRVDTSKGYIKGNIKVISQKANACKSDMTIEQAERLVKYMKGEIT